MSDIFLDILSGGLAIVIVFAIFVLIAFFAYWAFLTLYESHDRHVEELKEIKKTLTNTSTSLKDVLYRLYLLSSSGVERRSKSFFEKDGDDDE